MDIFALQKCGFRYVSNSIELSQDDIDNDVAFISNLIEKYHVVYNFKSYDLIDRGKVNFFHIFKKMQLPWETRATWKSTKKLILTREDLKLLGYLQCDLIENEISQKQLYVKRHDIVLPAYYCVNEKMEVFLDSFDNILQEILIYGNHHGEEVTLALYDKRYLYKDVQDFIDKNIYPLDIIFLQTNIHNSIEYATIYTNDKIKFQEILGNKYLR